jgi:hypothetical protein
MMHSTILVFERDLSVSTIGRQIRSCDLSLVNIDETRLQLAMQLAELNNLQRTIARRAHKLAMPNLQLRVSSRASRRGRDLRRYANN